MLGYAHALSSAAAGAVVAAHPAASGFLELAGPIDKAAWVVVCGGMGLLADLDHPGSTIARFWGPVSNIAAVVVGFVFRGHRGGTHDPVAGPLLLGVAAAGVTSWWWGRLALMAVAVGLGLRAIGAAIPGREAWDPWPVNLALSWGTAYGFTVVGGVVPSWMPYAVAVGVAAHIAGDALTDRGIPLPLTWLTGRPRYVSLTPIDAGNRLLNGAVAAAALTVTAAAELVLPWGSGAA